MDLKPPPDRLYGRQRLHALRPRQRRLLDEALPRFRLADPAAPGRCFPGAAALALDIGAGGGEHARALASADPALGVIAAEVFEPGLCSMLTALVPEGEEASAAPPANLRLWDGDARELLRRLPAGCLALACLMFPDPWPKARHAKRRFIHPANLALLARALAVDGTFRIATDDPTYQDWVRTTMAGAADYAADGEWRDRPEGWPGTRYEAKARQAGRLPHYWSFRRRSLAG